MSEQSGYETEDLEQQDESYEQDESTEEQETTVDPNVERLDRLEAMIQNLVNNGTKPTKEEKKGLDLSDEQVAMLKDNPRALLQIIEERSNKMTQEVNLTLQQRQWDEKAERDYPAIKSDSKFKELVKKHVNELASHGGMSPTSPKLLYLAAKLAASEYQPKSREQAKKTDTSAMRPGAKKPNLNPTDKQSAEMKQKTALLRATGLYSEEKIAQMLKKYESSYQEHTTRSGLKRRMLQL